MKKEKLLKAVIFFLAVVIIIQVVIIVSNLPKKKPGLEISPAGKGKIAIVLDDWGYNFNNFAILQNIQAPLTLSILPNLPYSTKVAEEANKSGFEVILHLPMEPHEKIGLEKNTILVSMDAKNIEDILGNDLNSIPHAKGASNHMGSRATEDSRVVKIILKDLKRRHLYFLDSFSSAKSVCVPIANQVGIKVYKRDMFLDNIEEYGYIRKQIAKLKARAKVYGSAIGIGHDRKITLEVLSEIIPQLQREGYEFVRVSELKRQ